MTYKINGTELVIQPTKGRWMDRQPVDIDGWGHPIYPPYRQFEMSWQLGTMEQADQLRDFFLAVGSTGTVVVDLPKYATDPYAFYAYTGCVLQEPSYGTFFTEHHTDIMLLVTRIRT